MPAPIHERGCKSATQAMKRMRPRIGLVASQARGERAVRSVHLGVKFFHAFRTDRMAELGFRVFLNIVLDLNPIPFIVADFFARGADGQKSSKGLDFAERLLQFFVLRI